MFYLSNSTIKLDSLILPLGFLNRSNYLRKYGLFFTKIISKKLQKTPVPSIILPCWHGNLFLVSTRSEILRTLWRVPSTSPLMVSGKFWETVNRLYLRVPLINAQNLQTVLVRWPINFSWLSCNCDNSESTPYIASLVRILTIVYIYQSYDRRRIRLRSPI